MGEIEVGITVEDRGNTNEVFDGDLVIAELVDWGIDAEVDEVKELIAGKFDQRTAKITLEENVEETLIPGRDLTLELPEWVKVTKVNVTKGLSRIDVTDVDELYDGENNYVDFPIKDGSGKAKIEFTLDLSIEGNKSGDIEAKIFGAGVEETSLVIAKAVAPVIPSIDKVNEVKIGIQNQPLADLTLVEGKKNSISKEYQEGPADFYNYSASNGEITLTLTEGAYFSKTPTVTVTDGNLEISQANVRVDADDARVDYSH
ncbi:MAG: hypothetical protein ACOX0Q_00810 [Syntrophomonadaceae bacterium]